MPPKKDDTNTISLIESLVNPLKSAIENLTSTTNELKKSVDIQTAANQELQQAFIKQEGTLNLHAGLIRRNVTEISRLNKEIDDLKQDKFANEIIINGSEVKKNQIQFPGHQILE